MSLRLTLSNDIIFDGILKANQEMQDKLSIEIKEMKIKKFKRDKRDSSEGNVYHWRNPERRTPQQRRGRNYQDHHYYSRLIRDHSWFAS